MLKLYFTIFIMILFMPCFLLAQTNKVQVHTKKNIDPNYAPVSTSTVKTTPQTVSSDPAVGEPIGQTTDYDIFTNSIVRDQIVYNNGVAHFANMIRPWGGVAARRMIAYTYQDGTNYVTVPVFDAAASSGWPQIDVSLTGGAVGTLAIVGHTPNRLAIWDGASSFLVSQFEAFTDPSMQFLGDNIYLATSGNRLTFQFFRTTDFGVTFENYDSIPTHSPEIYWGGFNGGVEVGMSKSQDETKMMFFGTNAANNLGAGGASTGHGYNGFPEDSSDQAWVIATTDGGTSWQNIRAGADGFVGTVEGLSDYAPLFENFGQLDGAVANDGVYHLIANGYGLTFNATRDTAVGNLYPVIYWNSNTETWVSISDPAVDSIQNISLWYPGNGIGQSFPGIAVSEDGQVVYATWSGPQITDGQIDTVGALYYTDTYHAWSADGGTTWTYGGVLAGDKEVGEMFAHPAQHLESLGGNMYRAHVVYMDDLSPGGFVFGEGSGTNNPIIYHTFDLSGTTAIDENGNLINSFELSQNYPNPFNPSTSIKYTIAERSNVTLKVFDMLGREVAILINSVKDAGSHEINFDASDLSSGLYVYTLNAGNFTSSRKMMLLK